LDCRGRLPLSRPRDSRASALDHLPAGQYAINMHGASLIAATVSAQHTCNRVVQSMSLLAPCMQEPKRSPTEISGPLDRDREREKRKVTPISSSGECTQN
jgi:hypothetical protein